MLGEMTRPGAPDIYDPAATGSLVEMMLRHLPSDSPLPAYLRRLLLDGGDTGALLFRRLFDAGQATLGALAEAGMAAPGRDPQVRAAFLMANDLAVRRTVSCPGERSSRNALIGVPTGGVWSRTPALPARSPRLTWPTTRRFSCGPGHH